MWLSGATPGALEHGVHLLGDQRHPHHRLGVGGGRVQPEEPALADDLAVSSYCFTPT